jgi:hypothetical protein
VFDKLVFDRLDDIIELSTVLVVSTESACIVLEVVWLGVSDVLVDSSSISVENGVVVWRSDSITFVLADVL